MLLAALALILGGSGSRPPDVVVLTDGTRVEGRVVLDVPERVVIRIGSRDRAIERKDIRSADSRLASWTEAFDRWRSRDKEDATKIADIAAFAKRVGLPEDARVFALRAIAVDPENRIARDLLGHERKEKDKDWTLREDSRHWTWTERVKRSASFGDGWELETTHWSLRTNLPLLEATNAILDLENVYSIFFAEIAPEVGAYHVDAPLAARIHADAASFPEIASGRGFYDRVGQVLLVNAAGGLDRGLLVHEAIHQVLAATAVLVRGGKGEISAWLDEGLAEYFRAASGGADGRLAFDAKTIDLKSVRAQALAKEPYKLSRVLVFDADDFVATSRQDLKYAQCCNFVHFLLAGDDGRYRPQFFTFLRGAWNGRGSPTDLATALGKKIDAVEKSWTAWVQEQGQ